MAATARQLAYGHGSCQNAAVSTKMHLVAALSLAFDMKQTTKGDTRQEKHDVKLDFSAWKINLSLGGGHEL